MTLETLLAVLTPFLIILLVWSGIWKAVALWKAARNNQLGWFVVICIVNTAGILEIIYIFAFQRKKGFQKKRK